MFGLRLRPPQTHLCPHNCEAITPLMPPTPAWWLAEATQRPGLPQGTAKEEVRQGGGGGF